MIPGSEMQLHFSLLRVFSLFYSRCLSYNAIKTDVTQCGRKYCLRLLITIQLSIASSTQLRRVRPCSALYDYFNFATGLRQSTAFRSHRVFLFSELNMNSFLNRNSVFDNFADSLSVVRLEISSFVR